MGPYLFLLEHLFCLFLPPQNPLDHISGYCRPWNMSFGDLELHGHFDHFFLRVNWSGSRTSATNNHIFYKALGRLHGPWCKQPLIGLYLKGQPKHCSCWLGVTYYGLNLKCPSKKISPRATWHGNIVNYGQPIVVCWDKLYWILNLVSPIPFVSLVNRLCSVTNTNWNLTLFFMPCKNNSGITCLQCWIIVTY